MDVPVLVITLKNHDVEWNQTKKCLIDQGFTNVSRFEAVNGSAFSNKELAHLLTPDAYTNLLAGVRTNSVDLCGKGSVGCFLSHYAAAVWLLDQDAQTTPYVLVCEEDLFPSEDFGIKFEKLFAELRRAASRNPMGREDVFDFAFYDYFNRHSVYVQEDTGCAGWHRAQPGSDIQGMHVYMMSRQGAAAFVGLAKGPIDMQVDAFCSKYISSSSSSSEDDDDDYGKGLRVFVIADDTIAVQRIHISTVQEVWVSSPLNFSASGSDWMKSMAYLMAYGKIYTQYYFKQLQQQLQLE